MTASQVLQLSEALSKSWICTHIRMKLQGFSSQCHRYGGRIEDLLKGKLLKDNLGNITSRFLKTMFNSSGGSGQAGEACVKGTNCGLVCLFLGMDRSIRRQFDNSLCDAWVVAVTGAEPQSC